MLSLWALLLYCSHCSVQLAAGHQAAPVLAKVPEMLKVPVPLAASLAALTAAPDWQAEPGLPRLGPRNASCSTPKCKVDIKLSAERDVKFLLYTRRNPAKHQELSAANMTSLRRSNFNPCHATKFLIHGWQDALINGSQMMRHFRQAYLSRANMNIIGVDWSPLASNHNYYSSAGAVSSVADVLSQMVRLLRSAGTSPDTIHLVGHSLGAHVAGVTGNRQRIGRITGLDPAGLLFEVPPTDEAERLNNRSARFVDVIHTCGGLRGLSIGYSAPLGVADFYPNNGEPPQPGCPSNKSIRCSHSRAFDYFVESITSFRGFWGVSCESWESFVAGKCDGKRKTPMGARTPRWAKGVYFVQTRSASPFAVGNALHSAPSRTNHRTPSPSAPSPSTPSPSTPTPSTPSPSTQSPSTPSPSTQSPSTPSPSSPTPSTPTPSTPTSSTPTSSTPTSSTPSPSTPTPSTPSSAPTARSSAHKDTAALTVAVEKESFHWRAFDKEVGDNDAHSKEVEFKKVDFQETNHPEEVEDEEEYLGLKSADWYSARCRVILSVPSAFPLLRPNGG